LWRRDFLKGATVTSALIALRGTDAMAEKESLEQIRERIAKGEAEALAAFPFERVQVSGKTAGRGAPVVIGSDGALRELAMPFHPIEQISGPYPSPAEIVAKADQLTHPEGLFAYRKAIEEQFTEMYAESPEFRESFDRLRNQLFGSGVVVKQKFEPPVGSWPLRPPEPTGLTVVYNWRAERPFDAVYIILIPTDDWTTIPAYLRWGNWNENPPPEYHVAALRSWRDRYGAELIGLGFDVMNIRVANKPATRDEAMALAREQYAYCNDVVDQGTGTLSNLAAALKAHDWWFFWWD
jgi:hypothetical protein